MSIERYLKDEDGFRRYVELMESTPTSKRQKLMDAAKKENPIFVAEAEKCILTFDRITRLPEMELTEVLGADGLKPTILAAAINSVEDMAIREKLIQHIPRNIMPVVNQELKDNPTPKPYDVGSARLQIIQKTRELEKAGKLESVQIPRFARDYFQKRAA